MKKIYVIITIVLISSYSCKAQTNQLTETEFDNIKINNITLRNIINTKGNETKIKTLLGSNIISQSNTTGPSIGKDFWNDAVYLNFEDESNTGSQYNLTNIQIKNSSMNINIKGITAKLGDNVNIFGNGIVLNTNKGDNSVVFISELSSSIAFKIDKITNKIIEIVFNSF